jgi:NAD(P)-dependent dehydrogenase (short-subunit alcohol dehydrogenase family)
MADRAFQTLLVAGAGRGIGLAVAEHLQSRADRLDALLHGRYLGN